MKRFHTLTVLSCLLAIALIAGCAALGKRLEPPRVALAGLRLTDIGAFEMALEVDLRVFNRNTEPLVIHGVDCDLDLNGRRFAQGVADPRKEIPAYGSDTVTVTVYASLLEMVGVAGKLIAAVQDQAADEKWTYAVQGSLRMGSGLLGKIPFDAAGVIDLAELTGAKKL
jgi:LEA14-like dessication related protein